jgi:hypothetical protein
MSGERRCVVKDQAAFDWLRALLAAAHTPPPRPQR